MAGARRVGSLLRKATLEGGAPPGGWSEELTQQEMPTARALNIALRSRGFQAEQAWQFVQTLYRGRFEGLQQAEREVRGPPEWWR